MDQQSLDKLLCSYASEPLRAKLEFRDTDVWREIARKKQRRNWASWLVEGWQSVILEPQLAVAALILAVFVGVVPSVLHERPKAEHILAQQSLHLDVFSTNSSAFSASLLRLPARK